VLADFMVDINKKFHEDYFDLEQIFLQTWINYDKMNL